jgi:hypothetical protein
VFLYALLAGLSPLALLATLAALGSGRGRLNGTVFALTFVVAQSVVLLIAFFLGSAAAADDVDSQRRVLSALELALGLLLLVFALRGLAGRSPAQPERSGTEAVLTRLRGLRPATAFSIGALLGIGGVKRLTVTLVTGATIAVAALERSEEAALALLYIVIAALLVWLPVTLYLIAGEHADRATARTESWLARNEQRVTSATMLVFGAGLSVDALVRLL